MTKQTSRWYRWPVLATLGLALGAGGLWFGQAVGADPTPVTPAGGVEVPVIPVVDVPAPPSEVVPAGGVGVPSIPPIEVPMIPNLGKSEAPPIPSLPATLPTPPVTIPPPPVIPTADKVPTPRPLPEKVPVLPAPTPVVPATIEKVPTPRPVIEKAPAVPVPAPVVPVVPSPAPIVQPVPVFVPPPAQPTKSPEATQPPAPMPPDLRLPTEEPRLTVKPSRPVPATPTAIEKNTFELPPGETPMTIRQVLLSSLFGAALAATPVRAVDPPAKSAEPTELKTQIDDVKKDVKTLQEFRKNIEDEIFGKGDGKTTTNSGLIKKMSDLEEKLKGIEATMKRIDEKLTAMAKSSTSGFGPPAATPAAKGTIRIVNDYPVEMSLMLNGKSHRLTPGEVKSVDVAAGPYTYELLSAGAQETKSAIKEGETVTLRIR